MEGDLGGTFGGACVLSGLRIRLKVGRGFGGDVGGRGVLPTYIYRLKPFYSRVGVGPLERGRAIYRAGPRELLWLPVSPSHHRRIRVRVQVSALTWHLSQVSAQAWEELAH